MRDLETDDLGPTEIIARPPLLGALDDGWVRWAVEPSWKPLWESLDPGERRAALRGWAVARQAGAREGQALAPGVWQFLDAAGAPFVLTTVNLGEPAGWGDTADVRRLRGAIEAALGEWTFVIHLRKPVPVGFDPEPVARAVHLWRLAIERGDWQGRHAIYEDDWVAVDLSVVRRQGERLGRWLVAVPPLQASDRLTLVYQRLLARIHAVEEAGHRGPVIFAPSAEPQWALSRGAILDVLYGIPDRVSADKDGFRAVFRASGLSLFSDQACRNVQAVWWLEGDDALQQWTGIAHENPWAEHPVACSFPGRRFASNAVHGPAVELSWQGETAQWK